MQIVRQSCMAKLMMQNNIVVTLAPKAKVVL